MKEVMIEKWRRKEREEEGIRRMKELKRRRKKCVKRKQKRKTQNINENNKNRNDKTWNEGKNRKE